MRYRHARLRWCARVRCSAYMILSTPETFPTGSKKAIRAQQRLNEHAKLWDLARQVRPPPHARASAAPELPKKAGFGRLLLRKGFEGLRDELREGLRAASGRASEMASTRFWLHVSKDVGRLTPRCNYDY